jgi:hypothetical protein
MSSQAERDQIREVLLPEILRDFELYAKEYRQERDLGIRGEFANLYRKTRKLKTVLWDGVVASDWRESTRTIIKEVVSHGLLMLVDWDNSPAGAVESDEDVQTLKRSDYQLGFWPSKTQDLINRTLEGDGSDESD